MSEALADCVIARHRKRLHAAPAGITIDRTRPTTPRTASKQFTFFNSHYDSYCYLPMVGFLTFNDEAEQYLVAAVLRPGNVSGSCGAIGIFAPLASALGFRVPGALSACA